MAKAKPSPKPSVETAEQGQKPRARLTVKRAAALSYLLGPISAVYFLVTDRRGEVRLQALQSLVFSGLVIASSVLLYYTRIGILLLPPLWLAAFLVWLSAIWRAGVGIRWRMPLVHPLLKRGGLVR